MENKIIIEDGIIFGTSGEIIGSLNDNASMKDKKIIQCGSELVPEAQKFLSNLNSGSFTPRKLSSSFERILDKYELKPTA